MTLNECILKTDYCPNNSILTLIFFKQLGFFVLHGVLCQSVSVTEFGWCILLGQLALLAFGIL